MYTQPTILLKYNHCLRQIVKVLVLLFLSLGASDAISQSVNISGIVNDAASKEPLAFVNIVSNDGRGAVTDIDGKFTLGIGSHTTQLKLTYVGYETKEVELDGEKQNLMISLIRKSFDLQEVEVLPGINPAHRIIQNVIDHRRDNDPEQLPAFTYTSYDKMILTVGADSIMNADTASLSANEKRIRSFLDKQDLFIMETVTERMYLKPGLNQENVIATKVSGFSDPLLTFMVSQIQSTSFYDELIEIAGKKYINPISTGSTRNYFFLMEDTIVQNEQDSVFIISYRPMKGKRFEGMKGFLSINTHGWAIQNVKATPVQDSVTGISIRIQQAYKLTEGHWFPDQLNTDVTFLMARAGDSTQTFPLIGKGRSYIRDLNLHPDLKKSDFGYHEIEIEEQATKRKGEFWKEYRVDSLSARDMETYRVIDSLGKEANFDKLATNFQTLLTGRIPMGIVDLDLNRIIRYNTYEGIHLGLGFHTNDKLWNRWKAGLYGGYGFGDRKLTYGGDLSYLLHPASETRIRIEAYNTPLASGMTSYFDDKYKIWDTQDFYTLYISQMNPTVGGEVSLDFRIKALRDFKWNMAYRQQKKDAFNGSSFNSDLIPAGTNFSTYLFNDAVLGFRFAYRERVLQTTKGTISLGSKYPILWLNMTKGFKTAENGFNYNKIDLKIAYTLPLTYWGNLEILLNAGLVDGQIPASNLYNAIGTYQTIAIYAPGSFGTMRPNEFLSDQYVALFLQHQVGNLFAGKRKFNPSLNLITNMTIGRLSNPGNQQGLTFKTLDNGYFESGFILRKMLNLQLYDLGIGALYRYGANGFPDVIDNIAFKIVLYYGF